MSEGTDVDRETVLMESPVYEVDSPMGRIWYPEEDYWLAFQMATGTTIEDAGAEHEGESRITTVEFDGPAEVPIADV